MDAVKRRHVKLSGTISIVLDYIPFWLEIGIVRTALLLKRKIYKITNTALLEEAWISMKLLLVQIVHALLDCNTNAVLAVLLVAEVNGSAPGVNRNKTLYDCA